jgi:methionyl-tRNA synthetase
MRWCSLHASDFEVFWRRADEADVVHFIGKDIVYFHALFWPATLMGAGFRVPTQIKVHGFLTVNGEKMSKARGTFINASTYLEHLDPQYLRYYYAAKLTNRVEDVDLSLSDFAQRVDSDLVNRLVNIPSRALGLIHRELGGRLGRLDEEGWKLVCRIRAEREHIAHLYEELDFAQMVRRVADMADEVNGFFQCAEPWARVRTVPGEAAAACTAALNAFRILATYLQPVLPRLAAAVADLLGLPALTWEDLDQVLEEQAVRPYKHLVQRVDRAKIEALIEASKGSLNEREIEGPTLRLDALIDVELSRVCVEKVEALGEDDKYLRLTVAVDGQGRDLVARLGGVVGAEDMVGRSYLVVTNLAARQIRGHDSQGMVLAAEGQDGGELLEVNGGSAELLWEG